MELSVLPAQDGDCLLLAYGDPPRHVLVDGGRVTTYGPLRRRLERIRQAGEKLELMVVTHFDADHIGGAIHFALDGSLDLAPENVWFNGFDELSGLTEMGPGQGDRLSAALASRGWPVNRCFADGVACLDPDGLPVSMTLGGGLRLTLLSPDRRRLAALRAGWRRWRDAPPDDDGPDPGGAPPGAGGLHALGRGAHWRHPSFPDLEEVARTETETDVQVPNGSSIAFLAEYRGRRILFGADAHPGLLQASVERLLEPGEASLPVDLYKVSHHGSARNTTPQLLSRLACTRFVVSTKGNVHAHPDQVAIARMLVAGTGRDNTLFFNYDQPLTRLWDDPGLKERYRFRCVFPDGVEGLRIKVRPRSGILSGS